jgi:hypothetical protein
VTTPGAVLEVGQRLLVNGGLAHALKLERDLRRASLSFATWAARPGLPASASAAVVPDPARLAEAQQLGLVHRSLASEPVGPDQLAA